MNAPVAYAICRVADISNRRARGYTLLRVESAYEGGEGEPWHVVLVRWDRKIYGYVNRCPHQGSVMDFEPDQFLNPSGTRLMCGKHGALFEIETGACLDGPCAGEHLEPLPLVILDGDVCVVGVALAEDVASS